ncbi:MAG: hypothetical protein SWJ54_08835 [Cyanobacteriota bacterium]|nr:hypothetical protein [Cyanobacteriota bacterium]
MVNLSLEKSANRQIRLWFSLSVLVAIACGVWAFLKTWGQDYLIQDDARSHVVWMFRFLDPELFPDDPIIDYFQSVAPLGYAKFYQLFATFGINPLLLSRILPIILGAIATGFCFGVCWEILPIPIAGFFSTLLLNQNLWLKDDLVTATPRAFFYPLFLAFLYFLLQRSLFGVGIAIALLGGFYPQGVLIAVGLLILHTLFSENIIQARNKKSFFILFAGLIIGGIVLLPYLVNASEWGEVITRSQAKTLPEFYPGGRASFFTDKPLDFWITGDRSGLLPQEWFRRTWIPPQVIAGLLLPVLLIFSELKSSSLFPLTQKISCSILILPELLLVSTGLFFLAHALAFKLHHPSRYSQHSLRIVMAIAGGIAVTLILDAILRKISNSQNQVALKSSLAALLFLLLCYPSLINRFPITNNIVGKNPLLYEFFAIQPKPMKVASLSNEVNNIPAFSKRSILVGSEYILPYHQKYYALMKQRAEDLISAQYSSDINQVKQFIQDYDIGFWMLDENALSLDFVQQDATLKKISTTATQTVEKNLKNGQKPILKTFIERCTVLQVEGYIILDSNCLLNS